MIVMTLPGKAARPYQATKLDLVGIREMARRLNVEVALVYKWRARGILPETYLPEDQIGAAVWLWQDLGRWAKSTGRL